MNGQPSEFEAIGNRLGFRIVEETPEKLFLVWYGPRFPAFLCLGIALFLLFISVPILQAISLRGFVGPAGSLWYFPLMNAILFGIAFYLIAQKRTILIDPSTASVILKRRSLHRMMSLTLPFREIDKLRLAMDQVYNGFAVAGSSAAQSFPVPSLRIVTIRGESVLLDRGSLRRLKDLGKLLSDRLEKPLKIDAALES
jgi:hypothetical protein